MAMRDPYEVLGVPRDAGPDEVKSAYRRLARRYHPDVNPGDPDAEDRFKEVGAAYAILSDPEKRSRFDQFGSTDDAPTDPFHGAGGFADIFEMFFGGATGGRARGRARNGEDLRADITITLTEVVTGVQKEVSVRRMAQCGECGGSGSEGGAAPESCGTCGGAGIVGQVRNTFIGQVRTSTTCPTCGGAGSVVKNPCASCKGRGLQPETARVGVSIPPGVDVGATIQMPGQGSEGIGGGRTGDLYVVLDVEDDPRFQRHGTTLFSRLELTFAQAALGDTISYENLDGPAEIDIPTGSQPGDRLTVKGAGLPPLHGGRRGDLVLELDVDVPVDLNEEQAQLVRQLAESLGQPIPKGPGKGSILGNLFGKKR
jgi:molecular chaperone DnaJ